MSEHDLSLKTARPWTLRPANDNGTRPGQGGGNRRRRGHGARNEAKAGARAATSTRHLARHLTWLSFAHPENDRDDREDAPAPVFVSRPDEAVQ